MRSTINYWLFLSCFVVAICSCKKWEDHIAPTEQALNENLMQHISKMANLSKFSEYLVKTGLDKEISSSKNYTVWAPNNEALQSLSADVVNDTAKLKAYLLNHISGQLFFTRAAKDSIRVPLINGKWNFFFKNKFDEASILQADIYVKNGVLHVVDKAVAPLPSIWEYILNTKDTYTQNGYISSLLYQSQDPSKAVLDSINPITGQPVYKPNTGIVQINTFRTKVFDIANEDSLYTYVLLTNSAFSSEADKQKPYFKSSNSAITNANASWNVVKDLAFKGLYMPNQLPGILLSKFNVHVPMNKAAIIETRKVSNGIVYIMSDAAAPITEKIAVCVVEGEKPTEFSTNIFTKYLSKVFYRQRMNTATQQPFKDIYLNLGSSGPNQYVDYITNNLYTGKYKVYWMAFNDKTISGQGDDTYGTDSTLQQILKIGADTGTYAPTFSVQAGVAPYQYNEVYLGEYTNDSYNWLLSNPDQAADGSVTIFTPASRRIRLQAPASVTSGIPYNLTLNYIKFVPSF